MMLCLFSLYQVRIDNNIPESIWVDKREDIGNGISSWVPVIVRYCVTAGSATSCRKPLRAERGRALCRSKPARERG